MDNYTVRHWGFIFMGFYTAVWMSEGLDQEKYYDVILKFKKISLFDQKTDNIRAVLIYSVLIIQTGASLLLFISDIQNPFSNSKNVADYIFENKYGDDLIIVSNSTTGPSVAAYLRKKVYYPECRQFGSYSLWNSYPIIISKEELINEVSLFRGLGYKRAIVVLYNKVFESIKINEKVFENSNLAIKYLKSFEGGMVKHENFDLFLITYK